MKCDTCKRKIARISCGTCFNPAARFCTKACLQNHVKSGTCKEMTVLDAVKQNDRISLKAMIERGENIDKIYIDDIDKSIDYTLACYAAEKGYGAIIQLLHNSMGNVDRPNLRQGLSPLHVACFKGMPEAVKSLVLCKVDINRRTALGETAVFIAASKGYSNCLKILCDAKANVDIPTYKRETPVHAAAKKGHAECLELLCKAGAYLGENGGRPQHVREHDDEDEFDDPPSFAAARMQQVQCLKVLHRFGAVDLKIEGHCGDQLVHAAAENGDESLKFLHSIGANLFGFTIRTPMLCAIQNNNLDAVKFLVENGFPLDYPFEDFLHYAVVDGTVPLLSYLVETWGQDLKSSEGLLHCACYTGTDPDILEYLLKSGYPTDKEWNGHGTPLAFAVTNFKPSKESYRRLELFDKYGADFNPEDHDVAFIASKSKYCDDASMVDLLTVLEDYGVDFDFEDELGRTPFSFLAESGMRESLSHLRESLRDYCSGWCTTELEEQAGPDHMGRSPASYAAEKGHEHVLKFFVEEEIDVWAVDKNGHLPAYYAALNDHIDVIKFFYKVNPSLLRSAGDTLAKANKNRRVSAFLKYLGISMKKDPSLEECANCGSPDPDIRCGNCEVTAYCAPACQQQHWLDGKHSIFCKDRDSRRLGVQPHEKDEPAEAKCMICFGSLSSEETRELPCKHTFHSSCTTKLVEHGDSHACPVCRAVF